MQQEKSDDTWNILISTLTPVLANDLTVDSKLAITQGRVLDIQFASLHNIVHHCCEEIEKAEKEILITTSYWEAKSLSAFMVARSLKMVTMQKPNVQLKIVVDNGSRENIGKKGNIRIIPRSKWKSTLGLHFSSDGCEDILVKSVHVPFLGTMHAKFLIVDGKKVVLSSNNIQDRPNVEMSVDLMGPVVHGFRDLFMRLFLHGAAVPSNFKCNISVGGNNESNETIKDDNLTIPMVIVSRGMCGSFSHDVVCPQNVCWWTLMSLAKNSILLCTPTFNARHAIEAVYEACKREIQVRMILTKNFNDKKEALPFQNGTNKNVINEICRRLKRINKENLLRVEWYVGEKEDGPRVGVHSHVKYLCVDEKYVVIGNGNMDTQSWYHSMEVNILLKVNDAR